MRGFRMLARDRNMSAALLDEGLNMKITKQKLNQIINEEIQRHHILQESNHAVLVENNNPNLRKILKERFEKLGNYYFEALDNNDKELAKTLKEEMNRIFEDLKT